MSNITSDNESKNINEFLNMFETYLDGFLTKLFYFASIPSVSSEKLNMANNINQAINKEMDIFEEIDMEPYESNNCCICNDTDCSLIKICNCQSQLYCYNCLKYFIKYNLRKNISSNTSNLYVLYNQRPAHNIHKIINPKTGRICDIRMYNYIVKYCKLECKQCQHLDIKYPNINIYQKYIHILSHLTQINYYNKEKWDPSNKISELYLAGEYPNNIPVTEFERININYRILMHKQQVPDTLPTANLIKLYYHMDINYHNTNTVAQRKIIDFIKKNLASLDDIYQFSQQNKETLPNDINIIHAPLNDLGQNLYIQYMLEDIVLMGIKEMIKRSPGLNNNTMLSDSVKKEFKKKIKLAKITI